MKIIERKIAEAKLQNLDPFVTRMGITTGDMTMGNIGSARKIEYTVIGDSVNSAFRLEGLNKTYGTRIILSEFTAAGLDERFILRELDRVRVKGKENPVTIHELCGLREELDGGTREGLDLFGEGMDRYKAREWEGAKEAFEQALRLRPEDGPSRLYLDRTLALLADPPGEDWAPVTVFAVK